MTPNPEVGSTPSRRRIWTRRLVILGLVTLGLQQAWRHGHDYVFADKFAAIEPGKIYRGAWQKDWPMRRIIRDDQIKTVVALAHPPEHPLAKEEKALCDELGVSWVHIPIVDDRSIMDGEALFDRLEEAAAVIADSKNQPVYGLNRASMAQIAYRTLYCDWTLEQATTEVARTFGLTRVDKGPDYRRMTEFYAERVLPRRQAQAKATPGAGSEPSTRR